MKIYKQLLLVCVFALFINVQLKAQADECVNAVPLTNLNSYCSNDKQFTNIGSTTASNNLGLPNCWGGTSTYDVWFRFTAVGTDVQMSVQTGSTHGTIKSPNIVLYTGTCNGTVWEQACSQGSTADVTSLYKGSLVPGTTYLIRISSTFANRGTFKFCISNYTPTVNPGADCDGAVKLCDKSDVKVAGLSGGGKNNKEIEKGSCFRNPAVPNDQPLESNSSWYKWTCAQAGTLTFDIIPNDPTNDLDFILYELAGNSTNACDNTRTILRCTATACEVTNGQVGLDLTSTDINEPINCVWPSNGYLRFVDMTAGKTYVLMVNNFSSAAGFTIKFGGTGVFSGPLAKISASGISTCEGETVTFDGSGSNNYDALKWIFNGGTPATASTVGPHTVKYNSTGTYTTYLTASDATCASGNSTDSIKVTVNPATTVASAGTAKAFCGTTATLDGNVAVVGTGTWTIVSGNGTITSPNDPKTTVTDLNPGINVFRWTISNPPCSSTSDTVTIIGVNIPSVANAGADQVICGGTSATLSANIPTSGTGKWTLVNGTGTITNPDLPNTTVTALGLGTNTFRWSISNLPCSDATDDVIIIRSDLPIIDTTNMVIKSPSCSQSDGFIHAIVVTSTSPPLSYYWNTVLHPSADIDNIPAGSYTLVVKDAVGCSSTMGPISVVNPNPPTKPVIVSGGDICEGKSIKVWVQNPVAGVDYTWTGPQGNPLGIHDTVYINNATLKELGKYSATGILSGCIGSTGFADVNVFENPKPIITGTTSICPGTSTVLSGKNSIPGGLATVSHYYWKFNGVKITPSDSSAIVVTKEGLYELVIENSNGCKDTSAATTLKFHTPPSIDASTAVIDSTNCILATGSISKIKVTGVPVLEYTWYSLPSNTQVYTSTTSADLKNVIAGDYILNVKDGNGCKDTSLTFTIHNFHTPAKPGISGKTVYCEGEDINPITVQGSGGTYTWYDSTMTKIFTGTTYTPVLTSTGGTIYIQETINGCSSKMDTVVIIINPLPKGNAGPDKHILCSGPTIMLEGTGTITDVSYSWIPSSGIVNGGTTLTPTVKDAGTYTLTVTNNKTKCSVQDQVVVIKDPIPAASFTGNPIMGEEPLTVQFTNGSTGSNIFEWDFGDKNSSKDKDPTNIFMNAGEYKVKLTVSDSSKCPSVSYLTILVHEKLDYEVPNIFTPNGDGRNDLFTLTSTRGIEAISGEIYDRWGLKLFSWNQKNSGWDGRSPSGSSASDGTYYYIIKIIPQDPQKEVRVEKGHVTLIR